MQSYTYMTACYINNLVEYHSLDDEDKEAYAREHGYIEDDVEDLEHESVQKKISARFKDPPTFNPDEFNKFDNDERAVYVNRKGTLDIINNSNKPIAKLIKENMSDIYAKVSLDPCADISSDVAHALPRTPANKRSSSCRGRPTYRCEMREDYSRSSSRKHPSIPSMLDESGLYMFITGYKDEDDFLLIKIGMSINVHRRLDEHDNVFDDIDDVRFIPCDNCFKAEKLALSIFKSMGLLMPGSYSIKGKNLTELLRLTEDTSIQEIHDILIACAEKITNERLAPEVLIEKEKSRQEEIKAASIVEQEKEKTKQLELQITLAKIQNTTQSYTYITACLYN